MSRSKVTKYNVNLKISSMTQTPDKFPEGTLLLPFIYIGDQVFDFLVFPKEICSIEVDVPESCKGNIDKIRDCSLDYTCFPGYKRICTLSEPFLSPFIQTLLNALSGQGVPDYPPIVKDAMNELGRSRLA
jgi:hypothetical protein